MPIDLSAAIEHHRQGRLEQAARLYEAALALAPEHPETLHLLGLATLQRGDPARAAALVSLDWDPACLNFHQNPRPVRTASAAQVRQPVHSRSVGRWKNYEGPLALLFAKIEEEPGSRADKR
jgi:tetratricopeptide (TPR) repeat protein